MSDPCEGWTWEQLRGELGIVSRGLLEAERERDEARAAAAAMRGALEQIQRNAGVIGVRCETARAALAPDAGRVLLERLRAAEAVCDLFDRVCDSDEGERAIEAWRAAKEGK